MCAYQNHADNQDDQNHSDNQDDQNHSDHQDDHLHRRKSELRNLSGLLKDLISSSSWNEE